MQSIEPCATIAWPADKLLKVRPSDSARRRASEGKLPGKTTAASCSAQCTRSLELVPCR